MYINDVLAQGLESGLIGPPQPIEMNITSCSSKQRHLIIYNNNNEIVNRAWTS